MGVLNWIWPLLADTMGVVYLAQEMLNIVTLLEKWTIAIVSFLTCVLLAWFCQGRWWWVIGFECGLGILMLLAIVVATCVMRLWIDSVQTQHASKHLEWRRNMRKERTRQVDELESLKKKLC